VLILDVTNLQFVVSCPQDVMDAGNDFMNSTKIFLGFFSNNGQELLKKGILGFTFEGFEDEEKIERIRK